MRYRFFDAEQVQAIESHLCEVLSGNKLDDAIAAMDFACDAARIQIALNPILRARRARDFRHFSQLLSHAAALCDLLRTERPLWETQDLNWTAFDTSLTAIIASARAHVHALRPPKRRGRPPNEWRDKLISVVFSVYPPAVAKKTSGNHFERTIEMLLEWLGCEIADLHSVVLEALHRRPHPPYTVTRTRSLRVVR